MYIKPNRVNDAKHLQNLYAHMDRSSHKYDDVRPKVIVQVYKKLTSDYNENMVHFVLEYETETQAELAANYILHHFDHPTYAMTVVGGVQPNGTYISPCVHIIYDKDYTKSLSALVNTIRF